MAKLRLTEETWGERLHRAYRKCRGEYGFVYADHAAAISSFVPISDQTLMRLETLDELPSRPLQRVRCWYALVAYGFDPEDFGLDANNVPLAGVDMRKVRSALAPEKRLKESTKNACSWCHALTHTTDDCARNTRSQGRSARRAA